MFRWCPGHGGALPPPAHVSVTARTAHSLTITWTRCLAHPATACSAALLAMTTTARPHTFHEAAYGTAIGSGTARAAGRRSARVADRPHAGLQHGAARQAASARRRRGDGAEPHPHLEATTGSGRLACPVRLDGRRVADTPTPPYTFDGLVSRTAHTLSVTTHNRAGRSAPADLTAHTAPCAAGVTGSLCPRAPSLADRRRRAGRYHVFLARTYHRRRRCAPGT